MKLENFENSGFNFLLFFTNGEMFTVDIHPLIGKHVSKKDLNSARIDSDWGCLEFCNGIVDIDPVTLYRYAIQHGESTQRRKEFSEKVSDKLLHPARQPGLLKSRFLPTCGGKCAAASSLLTKMGFGFSI